MTETRAIAIVREMQDLVKYLRAQLIAAGVIEEPFAAALARLRASTPRR